jgi:hypothetical protein
MRKVSTDLAQWRDKGGDTPSFMSAVVSLWLKTFPYHHPCLAQHHPHTAEQHELTLHGLAFYTLSDVGPSIRVRGLIDMSTSSGCVTN